MSLWISRTNIGWPYPKSSLGQNPGIIVNIMKTFKIDQSLGCLVSSPKVGTSLGEFLTQKSPRVPFHPSELAGSPERMLSSQAVKAMQLLQQLSPGPSHPLYQCSEYLACSVFPRNKAVWNKGSHPPGNNFITWNILKPSETPLHCEVNHQLRG